MKRKSICVWVFVGVFFLSVGFAQAYTITNLTQNGLAEASQISTYHHAEANRAIDNNTDGNYSHGSVTHTNQSHMSWWKVDLDGASLNGNYNIDSIVIYNRDSCQERLSNFTVYVYDADGNETWSDHFVNYPNPSITIDLQDGIKGETVKIQLDHGSQYLSLAEVQVMGGSSPVPLPGSALLLGSGLMGLLGMRRKKKRKGVKVRS